MANSKQIERVAIVGASGRIGKAFAEELLKSGRHTVTALTRKGSKSVPPKGAKVVEVDYSDEASIVAALQGQQFLIITLGITAPGDLHPRIVTAAGEADVAYIMPNIYGGDVQNKALIESSINGSLYVDRLAEMNSAKSAHIILVCGFWYEWSLALPGEWYGFDLKNRRVTFYDDGTTKINTSTWQQCGRAIAALLSLPETGASPCLADWKNKPLYISSFKASQRDMLDSIHRVTGSSDKDWEISYDPVEKRYQDGLDMLQKGNRLGFARALYTRVFFKDGVGDYESKYGLANDALGLPTESLDEATKRTFDMLESGWDPLGEMASAS